MGIDLARAALCLVDVQNGFITPDSAPVVPKIVQIAEQWVQTGQPIILTRFRNHPDSPYERLIGWRELHNSPAIDLVDELSRFTHHPTAVVVDKFFYTALTSEVVAVLQQHEVTDIVIAGIATDACVLKSSLDAFEMGYTPWIVRDAVRSSTTRHNAREIHDSALLLLGRLVGDGQLIESQVVLEALTTRT
ncbi:isochorismatase family protein [Nocardia sp. SYP-A9097]|uniref:cysteine hydrolase family protein n=1 Tax=Nocardia sp. SYP-A9097 TaxID=2663237 RepID=UPI00129BBDA4|nr:cysteine hydrolase [Nocardia sp. SYP-A9097]MRH93527.1 isochorismatase family protein [Nocardia sp. SYP-A9097]